MERLTTTTIRSAMRAVHDLEAHGEPEEDEGELAALGDDDGQAEGLLVAA